MFMEQFACLQMSKLFHNQYLFHLSLSTNYSWVRSNNKRPVYCIYIYVDVSFMCMLIICIGYEDLCE